MARRRKSGSKSQSSLSGVTPPEFEQEKDASTVNLVQTAHRPEAEIAFIEPPEPDGVEIPEQHEHFQLPTRFGAVPVDEAPLGWEVETRRREVKVTKFQHAYPTIRLPFQEVQRVEFGHREEFQKQNEHDRKLHDLFPTGANRLFFGDNLHVMRQLPSESIDVVYIDPPFFSGRNYNVIFGDKNGVRSFSDIWEGGMPGYLVWLNTRIYEMKRLLKSTGSIFVHLDWHASHYVKVEMDKIFGVDNFRNEIVWCYTGPSNVSSNFPRKHDILLCYTKGDHGILNLNNVRVPYAPESLSRANRNVIKKGGTIFNEVKLNAEGKIPEDWWADINPSSRYPGEKIGYPTQKPEKLIERILKASAPEAGVVADFFCGGGTTPTVAQRLNRRWVACDQSRIAVAITADRIAKAVEEEIGNLFPVPDFTVEHWGIYEAPKLET